jgi:hypothetical protein
MKICRGLEKYFLKSLLEVIHRQQPHYNVNEKV